MVHFIGSQDSTHDAVSVKSSSMLTTTKDRHKFLRAGGESEKKAGTFDHGLGSGQKQIGQPLYETVMSWSAEVAQTQYFKSLAPQHMIANTPVKLPGTYGENEEHSQSCQSSSEIVLQLLSTSQSPDTVAIVQDERKYASIRCFRGGECDGPPSTVGSLTPLGRCLPLAPTSKPKHVVES